MENGTKDDLISFMLWQQLKMRDSPTSVMKMWFCINCHGNINGLLTPAHTVVVWSVVEGVLLFYISQNSHLLTTPGSHTEAQKLL